MDLVQLSEYRKTTRHVVGFRDNRKCMMCKWLDSQTTDAAHIHHVFGRGASYNSVKESMSSLMSVCTSCHPQPILLPPIHEWEYKVLYVWRNMNCSPHNRSFIVVPSVEILNPIGLPTFKVGDGTLTDWRRQE